MRAWSLIVVSVGWWPKIIAWAIVLELRVVEEQHPPCDWWRVIVDTGV